MTNENKKRFVTYKDICEMYSLGRSTTLKLCNKFDAVVRFGKRLCRVDLERFDERFKNYKGGEVNDKFI